MTKPKDVDRDLGSRNCSASVCDPFYVTDFTTVNHERKVDMATKVLDGADHIQFERMKQITHHGWTSDHDDTHRDGELAIEAALWATQTTAEESMRAGMCGSAQDRLRKSRVRQLAIAGALIAAEIDRLLRIESQGISENARLHNDNE